MRDAYRRFKARFVDRFEPLRPIYDAWMSLIAAFSWLLTRVFLTVVFFSAFLVYGVLLRLLSKDPMNRGLSEDRSSYWAANAVRNESLSDFNRLY
jgi:hypothetical protein